MSVQRTNRVWAGSLDLTLLLDFWNFFPTVSQNKLCVSPNFIILGATDQKLWMFENFRRSPGSPKTFYILTFLGWIFLINS
jgi:hypothetical protein